MAALNQRLSIFVSALDGMEADGYTDEEVQTVMYCVYKACRNFPRELTSGDEFYPLALETMETILAAKAEKGIVIDKGTRGIIREQIRQCLNGMASDNKRRNIHNANEKQGRDSRRNKTQKPPKEQTVSNGEVSSFGYLED